MSKSISELLKDSDRIKYVIKGTKIEINVNYSQKKKSICYEY